MVKQMIRAGAVAAVCLGALTGGVAFGDPVQAQGFLGRFHTPVKVKDCWYFVSADQWYWRHPYQLTVRRLPTQHCEAQTVRLDASFGGQTLLVEPGSRGELVIAFSVRPYPYAPSPHPHGEVRLYQLSADTLETVRSYELRARDGHVEASRLAFEGNRLIVEGTKVGPMLTERPELGAGPGYVATFEHFLSSDEPPTVVASEELPEVPGDDGTSGSYNGYPPVGDGQYTLPFKVRSCWYFASIYMPPPSGPGPRMRYDIFVERLPVNRCEGARTWLGSTYDPRTLLLETQGENAIVLATSRRNGPLYIPFLHSSVQVEQIDPETLSRVRTAYTELSSPAGDVFATGLYLDGHRLVVEGTLTGPGGDSSYTATYEHFLDGDTPPDIVTR
ncbi:MAG TPA: hypothetical protein VLQ93_22645 [Myxococcaceae bacterium]|nr:hypothetical protein [Myxococcaceae bacterium]